MSERLIREWIRQSLLLAESSLTASEMSNRPSRFEKFLKKMESQEAFVIEPSKVSRYGGARSVIIPLEGNDDLVAALKSKDGAAYSAAFKAGVSAFDGSTPIILTAAGHLDKTTDMGGGGGGIPASIQNEIDFEAAVNQHTSGGDPISVMVGDHLIPDVVGAKQTGSKKVPVVGYDADGNEITTKETSKSDVNLLLKDGGVYPVSIKMPTAQYWLSGDSKLRLMNKFDLILQTLLKQPAPDPRIVLGDDGKNYKMVMGPDDNPSKISLSFSLPNSVAMDAVFGTDQNPVAIVAKGDFMSAPAWNEETLTLAWTNAKVFKKSDGIEGLPPNEKPVGLLRTGEMKKGGVRRGTKGYPGIRPAVASQDRASSTVNADAILAFQGADITEIREFVRGVLRESLFLEELTKSDKKEIERISRKQAKKEIDKVVGTSLEKTIQKEIEKTLKGKATRDEIADVTKSVVKKLYKDLSLSYPQVIDRIKV